MFTPLICEYNTFHYVFSGRYKLLTNNDTVYNITNNNNNNIFSDVDIIFESRAGKLFEASYYYIFQMKVKTKTNEYKTISISNERKGIK